MSERHGSSASLPRPSVPRLCVQPSVLPPTRSPAPPPLPHWPCSAFAARRPFSLVLCIALRKCSTPHSAGGGGKEGGREVGCRWRREEAGRGGWREGGGSWRPSRSDSPSFLCVSLFSLPGAAACEASPDCGGAQSSHPLCCVCCACCVCVCVCVMSFCCCCCCVSLSAPHTPTRSDPKILPRPLDSASLQPGIGGALTPPRLILTTGRPERFACSFG